MSPALPDKARFWECETPLVSENKTHEKQQSTVFDRHVPRSVNFTRELPDRKHNCFFRPSNADKLELFTEYHKPEDFQMTPLKKYERNSTDKKRQKKIHQSFHKEIGLDDVNSLTERTECLSRTKQYRANRSYSSVLDMLDDRKFNRKQAITEQFCKTRRDDTITKLSDVREENEEKEREKQRTELYVCFYIMLIVCKYRNII